jgi:hypothetical protein
MVERRRKKIQSTKTDKSITQKTKDNGNQNINTQTIKIVIGDTNKKKKKKSSTGSSSGGKKKKAIEALKAALEKFTQLKNLAKQKGISLPAQLGESPSNINQVNSIAEIEALTSDINNRITMIERLLQGPATPQQPQNLLGGEFAPRITPSPVEPAQEPAPQQPTPATQPDTSPQEYPQTSGDGVSDSDIANTLKEIADTVKSKAGKEGLDTGETPPDIPSGMGVDTNPPRGNTTTPDPLDIPPAQITPFNQELKNLSDKVSSLSLKLRTLEKFDAIDEKTEKAQIDLALPLYIEASNIEGQLNNLEAQAKGNDLVTVKMLLNDYDFEIGGLSIKGVDELIEKFQLFLSSRGYAFEDGQYPDEKEDPPVKKEDPPIKKYDEANDPLLTDKRNYMDTLSKKIEAIARNNNKLDIDFIDPSTLKPEKYKTINKELNDELESLNNLDELKNQYLRDLDPNKDDENKIIKDISGITLEAKNLKAKIQAGIKKINFNKIDMFNPNSELMEPPKTGFYRKGNATTPDQPTKLKKSKKKKLKVVDGDVTSYFDDILNVPADYEKQPTPAPFLNMSSKLRNLQGYSVDSFIDFEKLVVKSLGKSPDKSLDIGILKSQMDDLESARQLRLADLIKYQKAIVDNNITLTPQQQSILDAYKKELSFTTKKLVKILVNKNKPGKTIGIFDNQGNAIGLIN